MSTDKFDKRLRNLFSQYEAKLEKSEWERMNGFLQSQKSRRRKNVFFSLLMLLLTLPYFLSAFYNNSNQLLGSLLLEKAADGNSGNALTNNADPKTENSRDHYRTKGSGNKNSGINSKEEIQNHADKTVSDNPDKQTSIQSSVAPDKKVPLKISIVKKKKSVPVEKDEDLFSYTDPDPTPDPLKDPDPVKKGTNEDASKVPDPVTSQTDSVKEAFASIDSTEKVQPITNNIAEKIKNRRALTPPGRFMVAFHITPAMAATQKSVKEGREKEVHEDYNNVSRQEKARFGFESGLDLSFRVFRSLSFRTGVNYRLSGQHNEYDYKIERIPVIDAKTKNILGYIKVTDSVGTKISANTSLSWVTVPFSAAWYMPLGSRFAIRLETGVEGTYLASATGSQARSDNLRQQKLKAADFNRLSWGWNVNAAFIFPLSHGFSAAISPSYSKLSDFSRKENSLKSSSSQVGLGFSVMFNLSSLKR